MSDKIFREKSLDSIKTPENLDQYIKVSNASGWILLISVLFFLLGAVIWGIYGTIEVRQQAQALVTDGTAICTLSDYNIDEIKPGMTLRINSAEGKVWSINSNTVTAKIDVPDGIYNAFIITEEIKPVSLIFD